jgi:hypothetical protein
MTSLRWRPAKLGFALALVPLLTVGATAQILVSANDNKAVLINGANVVPANPAADTVSIIDLGVSPPKLIGEVKAPASVIGPPQSVAISRDESFALVTGAFKVDPADPKKAIPDNKLSVIDLKAKPPAVIAILEAGLGAAADASRQNSAWRFKIGPESCRVHSRWQERPGNSRWRQPGFNSHHRRQQGRG